MYPITFLTSYLLLVFCHFSATEPPPHHGYGPPTPVEFGSNEVSSHEQYNSPGDFGTYGSFSGGSPSSSYSAPSSGAYRKSSGIGSAHYSGGGFPESYKGSKGGVSSSYISIVHGGGAAGSASKSRPVAAYSSGKPSSSSSWPYGGDRQANYGPAATFSDGKFGGSNAYEVSNFGHNSHAGSYSRGGGFGAASSSPYSSGFEYSSAGYHGGGGGGGSAADHNRGGYSELGGGSDEVASYSSGGPSYVTFNGAKANFGHSSFGGSRGGGGGGGNAYSTANVIFGGGSGGGSGGVRASHGNIHTPSFSGNFKPSATKAYAKYSSQNGGGYSSGAISSANNFGVANPLVGSETGYNSRALKSGYSVDAAATDDYNGGEDPNVFAGFGDGAGFKVQSSYSTG